MTAPIYLFTGPEFGERNDSVKSLKDAMKKKFGSVDDYLYYASETPVSEILTILQSESLFTSASCVVYRGAELLKKKEDVDMLASWVKSVQKDSAELILVSDEIFVDPKLDKLVPQANKRVFWEMFEDRKIPWLNDFFRKAGYSVTPEAAEDILDMVENNTESLKAECSRFFACFPKGHEVTSADADALLAHNREENAFTLFNEMTSSEEPSRVLENSLGILQKIRLSKDSASFMLIAGLTSCFRRLEVWHKLHSGGYPDESVLKMNGFTSKKARTQYGNASRVWSSGQTAAILALLAAADMDIRSGGSALEDTVLQKLLYEIIIKKGASCAEYA